MRLITALLFALQSATFAGSGSSTIDPTQPAFGSGLTSAVIRNQFQAAINDINALIKNNSGTAAPTSPALGQMWLNTSVNPYLLLQYDGSMWVTIGSIDPVAHTFNVDGYPIGASGATIPLNNGNNTSSGDQTHTGTETFTGTVNLSSSSFTPITNASYARALSSLATDNYDVKDWGDAGTCSSDADDTAAFNAASAAVSTAIGGNGKVGVITYSGACHVCGLEVKRNTLFKNNGGAIIVTTGCSATVPIASENYSTLENTAAECGINVDVPSWFGFWDADIDCNSSGGSYSGVCVGTYGPAQLWVGTNTIRNGKNSPMLRTEDSVNGNSQNNPQCQEEGFFDAMIIRDSAGRGWDFRGPHDSVINSITGAWNADYSFYQESSANYNGAIDHLGSIHTYAEANGKGIYLATHLKADSVMVDGDEADIPSSDVHITQMTVYNCGAANDSSCLNVSGNLVTIDALLGTYVTGATGATMVDWTGSQGVISAAQYQGLNNASDFGLVVTGSNNQFTNQIGSGFGGTSSAAFSLAGHDNVLVAQGFGNKTNLAYTGSTKNSVTLKLFTTSGQTGISGTPGASDQFNVMIDGTTVSNYVKFPGDVQTPLLQASSATTFQGQFTSTGANQASVQINDSAGGHGAFVQYFDAGVSKWIVGQNSSNQYTIFDQVNSANAYTIATSGDTTIGEAGKTVTLTGNSSSTGTFTATEVLGTSATALQGNFISTGSNQATVQINDLAGSQGALLVYLDAGTIKWQLGQNTTNQFTLFDQANSLNAWTVATTGNTTLGETGKTVTINGNTTVSGGSLTAAGVVSTTATALQGNFGSTGAHQATVEINNAAGGQGSFLGLYDAGAQKWLVGDNGSNSFVVFDQANSANAVQVSSAGNTTLGESAKTLTLQGTVNVPGTFEIGGTAVTLPVPAALGGSGEAGTITGALKGNGTSAFTRAGCADLSDAGTGCPASTGTSGATIPLNNGGFTQSGLGNFTAGLQSIANGDTNSVRLGPSALQALAVTNSSDVAIGPGAAGDTTTGTLVMAGGAQACAANTTGSQILCVGAATLQHNTTGSNLSAGGYGALLNNTIGSFSSAFGAGSLFGGDCDSNSFFGYDSGQGISGAGCGGDNTGIGRDVMGDGPVTGTNNFGASEGALNKLTSGTGNNCVGSGSCGILSTGSFNDVLGKGGLGNYNGTYSVSVGYLGCVHATSGNDLVCIGANTGPTLTTGANDILLGQGIDVPSASTSNYMSLANIIKVSGINTPSTATTEAVGLWSFDSLISVANGLSTAPSYSFTNSGDAGCYLSNASTHAVQCKGGSGGATSNGGFFQIVGGPGGSTSGNGGIGAVNGGTPIDGNGGNAQITASAGASTTGAARNGGDALMTPAAAVNGGTDGSSRIRDSSGTTRIQVQGSQITVTGTESISTLTASQPVYTDASQKLTSTAPAGYSAVLSGTSASLGGGALLAGACSNGTTTVTGATTSMAVSVSAAGGTDPGDAFYVRAYVSSADNVTVKVCASIAGTPTATTYNVRVHQ